MSKPTGNPGLLAAIILATIAVPIGCARWLSSFAPPPVQSVAAPLPPLTVSSSAAPTLSTQSSPSPSPSLSSKPKAIPTPTPTPIPTPVSIATPTPQPAIASNCDPSYPDLCIPVGSPDLDCGDMSEKNFRVTGSDPHRFDRDKDGIGCES